MAERLGWTIQFFSKLDRLRKKRLLTTKAIAYFLDNILLLNNWLLEFVGQYFMINWRDINKYSVQTVQHR